MRAKWIIRNGSDRLVVVFGGWALGYEPLETLTCASDLLFVDDYRKIDWVGDEMDGYGTVQAVAWSFGVAALAHWSVGHPDSFDRKVAVNGTLTPVDRRTGIPPVVFQRTHDSLDAAAFSGFVGRVFDQTMVAPRVDIEEKKTELACVAARGPAPEIVFDHVWISGADKIFPPANQRRAWAGHAGCVKELPGAAHAPFDRFSSVEELLA